MEKAAQVTDRTYGVPTQLCPSSSRNHVWRCHAGIQSADTMDLLDASCGDVAAHVDARRVSPQGSSLTLELQPGGHFNKPASIPGTDTEWLRFAGACSGRYHEPWYCSARSSACRLYNLERALVSAQSYAAAGEPAPRQLRSSLRPISMHTGLAMKVREYLATLKRVIITCRPEDTIETAATLLATNHIGAMPVRDANGRVVGMFSERDIIRAFSQRGKEVGNLLVGDLMAKRLIACAPEDMMVTARKLMKANRIRHLLVMEAGQLVGLLSISDVLEAILQDTDMEVHVLRDHVIAVR